MAEKKKSFRTTSLEMSQLIRNFNSVSTADTKREVGSEKQNSEKKAEELARRTDSPCKHRVVEKLRQLSRTSDTDGICKVPSGTDGVRKSTATRLPARAQTPAAHKRRIAIPRRNSKGLKKTRSQTLLEALKLDHEVSDKLKSWKTVDDTSVDYRNTFDYIPVQKKTK